MNVVDLAAPVTLPGYLIEIEFDPPRHFSTRGLQMWGGNTWVSSAWVYTDEQLTLPGGDPNTVQLILSQGIVGRRVRIWVYYGATATDSNTELTFDGVCDGAPSLVGTIKLALFDRAIAVLYAPRLRIRPELGFGVLPQKELKVVWDNITIVFKDEAK